MVSVFLSGVRRNTYLLRCRRWGTSGARHFIEAWLSIAQGQLRRDHFMGDIIWQIRGGKFLGCLIAHPSSWRVNVNRQGEGLSCGGESILTEEGPDPTEFPEWVEGIGKPGDRGMSKSAVSGTLVAPVTALPPSDLHVPAHPGGEDFLWRHNDGSSSSSKSLLYVTFRHKRSFK